MLKKAIVAAMVFTCACRHGDKTGNTVLDDSANDTVAISAAIAKTSGFISDVDAPVGNVDSARYWFGKTKDLMRTTLDKRWFGKYYIIKAGVLRNSGYMDEAMTVLDSGFAILKDHGSDEDRGDAFVERTNYYDYRSDTGIRYKIRYGEDAAKYYMLADAKKKYADQLCELGDFYMLLGEDSTAKIVDTVKKALNIYAQIGYRRTQYAYDIIGQQYAKEGNFHKALQYALLAIKNLTSTHDTSLSAAELYNNIALYYFNLSQNNRSYPYFTHALKIAERYNSDNEILVVGQGLISSFYTAHEYDSAIHLLQSIEKRYPVNANSNFLPLAGIGLVSYAKTKHFNECRPYLDQLLAFSRSRGALDRTQAYVYNYLIIYYLETSKYDIARKYCKLNDSFCKTYNIPRIIAANYSWWSKADSGLGDFSSAYAHYKQSVLIKDTLFKGENARQINELQIKYETEKKQHDISILTQKAALQQERLKQSQFSKNVFLAGTAMLALMLGLGYNRYRLKQRNNKTLERQQAEINEKNLHLEQLLKEKEWLMKEIHHRVKNNLQIVISLLSTQSKYLDNDAALKAINESQNRMHAMSLIHQKLYQSDDVATVNMHIYITELIEHLKESYTATAIINSNGVENVDLDISKAIPVGLILNEAITNSIKYAFPNNGQGNISVLMHKDEDRNIVLIVTDNGVGLPVDFDNNDGGSLGMSLIKGLTAQLNGKIDIISRDGVKIIITFPYSVEV